VSEESLVVKLKGDTADLDKKLDKTSNSLNELDDNTKKSDKSLASMGKVAGVAGGAIATVGKAAIAVGTALTTMITLTAKSEQELQALSRQAKLTTGEFEALAFATKQYGINAEQVADISKDISDKLGEFASTGTGAFQDFADVTGKTTEEAQALAAEWQNLSSQQVIQEIANQLEDAGASANETTFVFESLGNDLSKLTPLFADNGKELTELTKRYNDVNSALSITQKEAEGLTEAATSFDLLTETLGNGAKVISAQLAPALNEFFNSIIEVVPTATNTIVDFINKFREAANIDNISSINRELEELTQNASDYQEQINAMIGGEYVSTDFNDDLEAQAKGLSIVNERIAELIEQRDKLQNTQGQVDQPVGGLISGSIGSSDAEEEAEKELQLLIGRLKTEEQILGEQYAKDLETAAGQKELLKEIERQYLEDVNALRNEARQANLDADQEAFDAMDNLRQQALKKEKEGSDELDKQNKIKSKSDEAYLDAAMSIGNALFEDQKAVKAGLVVVDTAAGISKAFAELPYPAALAASASIAATGVAQLAAITSASKGGGSTSSAVPAESLPDEVPELEAQNSDLNGSNQTVTIRFDDSTELGVAFNNAIERSRQDGLI
jgi:hypothetical protein